MNRRNRQRGLSLLEILVTISLITTVLVAFAGVYPASLKLNKKSQRNVQAAEMAGAIAEEIRALPFSGPAGLLTVQALGTTPWDPTKDPYKNFPRTPLPEPYTLFSTLNQNQRGILVNLSSARAGEGPTLADIVVTIYWRESANERMIDKQVSVRTSRTSNR